MTENRKSRRFQLRLPMTITRCGRERLTWSGLTNDISSEGVSFISEFCPAVGGRIEYEILLNNVAESVMLSCVGNVVRAEALTAGRTGASAYAVGATVGRYRILRARDVDEANSLLQE